MTPVQSDNVKIFFKNGLQVEGKVYSWGKKKIQLVSDDGCNFMVIQNPKEIVMYKITKTVTDLNDKNFIPDKIEVEDYSETFKSIEREDSLDLRAKNLADLHKLKIEKEKKEIANKLKEHHITEIKKVKYEQPGFFKK